MRTALALAAIVGIVTGYLAIGAFCAAFVEDDPYGTIGPLVFLGWPVAVLVLPLVLVLRVPFRLGEKLHEMLDHERRRT